MLAWLASTAAAGIFKLFGDNIVQPLLQVYLKSKDVNLAEFQTANTSTVQMASAMLQAHVQYADIKSRYALSVLHWWPFRTVLFLLLLFPAMHFIAICCDATFPHIFGYEVWNIDPIKGAYSQYEHDLIEFFIVAKPVDTAISGALDVLTKYLRK